MERREILNILLAQKERGLEELKNRLIMRQRGLTAFDRVKSDWADFGTVSSKNEYLIEISRIGTMIQRERSCLGMLRSLPPTPQTSCVALNSMVTLSTGEIILILDKPIGCGACSMNIGGKEITCVSPQAPLAKAILNKRQGDSIYFREITYQIINIQ